MNSTADEDYRICSFENGGWRFREFIIVGIICPAITFFGFTANVINVIIFTNRRMRESPINWYFSALSVFDLFVLVGSLFMLSFPSIATVSAHPGLIAVSRHIMKWTYPIALIAQSGSVWTTLIMASFRCFGICCPFKVRQKS